MSSEAPPTAPPKTAREGLLLTVIDPGGERRRVRVDRSPFRIGRLPDRELTLNDSRISRDHAQILLEDGHYYIEDSGSRHGLFLNGRKVERARIRPRDRVHFGIEDSFQIYIGEEPQFHTPLLKKVASMRPLEGTGNLGRLSAVLDVARALETSGTVDDVLAAAVDAALTVTGAERGFLMLKEDGGELRIRVARDQEGRSLPPDDLQIPRKVIAKSLEKRNDLFAMSFDPGVDPDESAARTVRALELRSVVCVPVVRLGFGQQGETRMLNAARDTIGVLYMDTRQAGTDLAKGAHELLQTLAVEISTVLENARLLEEERKKHHLEQELQIAREIQQALLPAKLPEEGWLVAAGSSEACFQVGGDYYDVMDLPPDRWGAVLADVSGKGVSAALLTSLLQGAFFSATLSDIGLAASVERINRYICERSRHARFATAFCCVARRDGALSWINAGHCAVLLARESGETEWLEPTTSPIGLFPDLEFPESELRLEPGDKLVIYSDGVSEAANWSNERYGEQRIADFVRSRSSLSAAELHEALIEDVQAFTQGAEQGDDLTLLVLAYRG